VPATELLVLLVAVLAPLSGPEAYWVTLVTKFLAFAVLAISVDLLWGFGGMLPFGQAAIFGVGAYASALSLQHLGPVAGAWTGIALAIGVPALLGALLAWFLFSGRNHVVGFGFGIVTLALGLVLQLVITDWSKVTGGSNGLYGYATPQLGFGHTALSLDPGPRAYYAVLAGTVLAYLFARWFVGSPFGLVLIASSANERRAAALGHSVGALRALTLVISFGLAGFAGALYVPSGFATPDILGLSVSTSALIWVAIGGRGTLLGAVVGAVGLSWLQNYLTGRFVSLSNLVLGALLVVIVLAWPTGAMGAARAIGRQARRLLGRSRSRHQPGGPKA
jgi:ABC-type branched-subunit amino acid transport system permease subunit